MCVKNRSQKVQDTFDYYAMCNMCIVVYGIIFEKTVEVGTHL